MTEPGGEGIGFEPGRVRAGLLLVGAVLAVTGAGAMWVASAMRSWSESSWYGAVSLPADEVNATGGAWALALLWALLVLGCLLLVPRLRDPWSVTGWGVGRVGGPLVAGGLAAVVSWQVNWLTPAWPLRPGGVLAVAGVAALLVGWVIVVVAPPWRAATWGSKWEKSWQPPAPPWRRAGRVGWSAVVAALLVLVGLAVVGSMTAAGQVVDSSVAAPLPGLATAPPARLAMRWQVSLGDGELAAVSGRYALVLRDDGIQIWDAATGTLRWHYQRRADRFTLVDAPLTADGSTVVAVYRQQDAPDTAPSTLVIGLDIATGQTRWQWSRAVDPGGPEWQVGLQSVAAWQVVGDQLVDLYDPHRASVTFQGRNRSAHGFDLRSGAMRWSWSTPADCAANTDDQPVLSDAVFVVSLGCGTDQANHQIRGYSATTGQYLWTWASPSNGVPRVGDAVAATFLVDPDVSGSVVRLDAHTGQVRGHLDTASVFGTDPIIAVDDSTSPTVAGLDPVTGVTRWQQRLPIRFPPGDHVSLVAAYPTVAYLAATGDPVAPGGGPITVLPIRLDNGQVPTTYELPDLGDPVRLYPGPGVLLLQTLPSAGQTPPAGQADNLYGFG